MTQFSLILTSQALVRLFCLFLGLQDLHTDDASSVATKNSLAGLSCFVYLRFMDFSVHKTNAPKLPHRARSLYTPVRAVALIYPTLGVKITPDLGQVGCTYEYN